MPVRPAPTCGCSSLAGSIGLAGPHRSCLLLILQSPSAEAPCSQGLRPCTRGQLVSSPVRGSSGGLLVLVAHPARRPVPARACAHSRRLRRLTSRPPFAGLHSVSSCRGAADGAPIVGPSQGGRTCRQTWCRVSSLCFRATRVALFSSVAFHSSNAHGLRSAACPAAQVVATLPSSGVSHGGPLSPWGVCPRFGHSVLFRSFPCGTFRSFPF